MFRRRERQAKPAMTGDRVEEGSGTGAEPTEAALLAEYRAAQEHVGVLNAAIWQSSAILIGGSIAAIAVILQARSSTPLAISTSAIAVAASVLLELWIRIWERHKAAMKATQRRMRDIESQTGMRRNIYLYLLSRRGCHTKEPEWQCLGPHEKKEFEQRYLSDCMGLPGPEGHSILIWTARVVQVGWLLLMIGKWLELWRA